VTGGGRRTDGADTQAADAIRNLVGRQGRQLHQAVVVAQTELPDGSDPRTETFYPLGAPDPAIEAAMLARSLDRLRHDQ
jgi:hypothetical protein